MWKQTVKPPVNDMSARGYRYSDKEKQTNSFTTCQPSQHNMERRLYFLAKRPYTLYRIPQLLCHLRIPSIQHVGLRKRGIADYRPPSEPRCFPSSGWDKIDPSLPVEEESIPSYRPENFYPARIGEVFNHRYQVVGKLGCGSSATVWLCRELQYE